MIPPIVEARGFSFDRPQGDVQFDPPDRVDECSDGVSKVLRGGALALKPLGKDLSRFLLHRTAMTGRLHAQLPL